MDLENIEQQKLGTLDPTWSVLDREPGMDDLAEGATDILKKMGEDLKIYPFQDRGRQDRLFLARFELIKFGENFRFSEAAKAGSLAFIDFLAGFPIDDVEMLVLVGEFSSKASKVSVQPGTGVSPPMPKGGFFKWPDPDKVLLNLTALPTKNVAQIFAPNLGGEPKPSHAHWWLRVQIAGEGKKWPVPGEFLGLGVRMFPGMFWGRQKSSPFVYSGNWLNSVYLSSARIKEVIAPDDIYPYCRYLVTWQKFEITANPSDFCEYRVNDRVSVLKDVSTTKTSQTWKDEDQHNWGDNWALVPITYYGGI